LSVCPPVESLLSVLVVTADGAEFASWQRSDTQQGDQSVSYRTVPVLNYEGKKTGDVTLGISTERMAQVKTRLRVLMLWFSLAGAVLAGGLVAFTARRRLQGLEYAADVIGQVGSGDFTLRMESGNDDEVGLIQQSFNRTLVQVSDALHAIHTNSETLATSAVAMATVSDSMETSAQETSRKASVVSESATKASKSVHNVAVIAEETNASIREVANNALDAAKVANKAMNQATKTVATIQRLADSSVQIDKVLRSITEIAQQTNLLALNATIEAARAGDAGRGFAVVAKQVKELAEETGRSTEEIGDMIVGIESDTKAAVQAIHQIYEVIQQVNEFQAAIAAAVEEVAATTGEMGQNLAAAAHSTELIASEISDVRGATEDAVGRSNEIQEAATHLEQMSAELQQMVSQFRIAR